MALEELLVSIVSKLNAAGFEELERREKRADKMTRKLSGALRNMFVAVVGTVGVKELIDASVTMDSLQRSFNALAGSEIGGAEQIKYLREEADRLGQDFVTAAEAYKNLFAAGKGAGMDTSEIQNIFSAVLEAGTVLGSSESQVQGALMAMEQMISKGKVSMEELRRQLGNALPGAMQIAAKAMGTTSEGLEQMIKDGVDSQVFVSAFANQLRGEFGGAAEEAAKGLRGSLNKLRNAVFELKTAFLNEEDSQELANAIAKIAETLKSPVLHRSLHAIGKVAVFLLKHFKLLFGIAVIMGIRRLIGSVTLLGLEFLTASHKMKALDLAARFFIKGDLLKGINALRIATIRWGRASMVALIPWAKLILILLAIKEIADTLAGKKTVLNKLYEATQKDNPFADPSASRLNLAKSKKLLPGLLGVYQLIPNFIQGQYNYLKKQYNEGLKQNGTVSGTIPVSNNTLNIAPGAIQINARTDNPKELSYMLDRVLRDRVDNFNLGMGYARSATT